MGRDAASFLIHPFRKVMTWDERDGQLPLVQPLYYWSLLAVSQHAVCAMSEHPFPPVRQWWSMTTSLPNMCTNEQPSAATNLDTTNNMVSICQTAGCLAGSNVSVRSRIFGRGVTRCYIMPSKGGRSSLALVMQTIVDTLHVYAEAVKHSIICVNRRIFQNLGFLWLHLLAFRALYSKHWSFSCQICWTCSAAPV